MISVIRGINTIVATINPSNENPPARYNVFSGDILGSKIDKINIILPIKSIERFETFFSSTVPSTIFLLANG